MVLAADVGGTKTLLGLFARRRGRLVQVRSASYPSGAFSSFESMLRRFLAEGGERPRRAAIGVAGPVVRGKSAIVNLEWPVSAASVARALGGAPVALLNDLEATAWGLPSVPPSKIVNLTPRCRPREGNGALIAPGTGLGMAILVRRDGRFEPSASEGGHQDFAPRDEVECALLEFMRGRLGGRVSVERIVSGPGFAAIYDFLVETGRGTMTRAMRSRLATGDRNAAVAQAGAKGEDATAARAVDLFVGSFGAVAGNLALVARATAGVWIAGGIAPRMLPKLREGRFLAAFRDKGRLEPFLSEIPIKVVLEPRAALLGAAAFASRMSA